MEPVAEAVADQAQAGEVGEKPESASRSVNAAPEKLLLKMTALENTWVKVIMDEKESSEYALSSGDTIELEASNGYNLLIGNAGGIKLTLNDKAVFIPGESGEVVTMHLP